MSTPVWEGNYTGAGVKTTASKCGITKKNIVNTLTIVKSDDVTYVATLKNKKGKSVYNCFVNNGQLVSGNHGLIVFSMDEDDVVSSNSTPECNGCKSVSESVVYTKVVL